jgi:alkaline phosphatase D
VVLWTRLVPDLFVAGGGLPRRKVPVDWKVATDPGMHHVVRHGSAWALPQLAHSVHVQLRGLRPDRDYFYQFRYRQDVTEVAHTARRRTRAHRSDRWRSRQPPARSGTTATTRRTRAMAEEDIDFVLHLGDYVYEYGIDRNGGHRETRVPAVLGPSPVDLPRWRMQYELHKSDPQLQLTHRRFPFVVTWDDHEVSNDYANTHDFSGDIAARRAAAYQAWYEHMPVWAAANPKGAPPRIYGRMSWGDLMQIHVLDGRQYRDIPPCGWGEAQACEAAYDPAISMLGRRQENWLYDGLRRSDAQWTVLGSNVMMARLGHDGDLGDLLWNDAWDGFPEARNRRNRQIVQAGVRNPMVLRRLALDLRQRHSQGLRQARFSGHRDGVRRHVDLEQRRHPDLRSVLRPHDQVQPAHQVLRRRPTRLPALQRRPTAVAHRPAHGAVGGDPGCSRLHLRVVRRAGRDAGRRPGLADASMQASAPTVTIGK